MTVTPLLSEYGQRLRKGCDEVCTYWSVKAWAAQYVRLLLIMSRRDRMCLADIAHRPVNCNFDELSE